MIAEKFNFLVENIVRFVGGRENIKYFTHCMTRLRFNLLDKEKVKVEELISSDGVIDVLWSGEQLQIIIGTEVNEVYERINQMHNLSDDSSQSNNSASFYTDDSDKFSFKALLSKLVDGLTGTMTPIIPMLMVIGLVTAVYSILGPIGLHIISEKSSIYQILYFFANSGLYFMPIAVAISGSRKFGANIFVSVLLTSLTLYPDFVNSLASGEMSILGVPIPAIPYNGQILPMILSTFILSKIEIFLNKIIPSSLKSLLVPLTSALIMLPLLLYILGPAGILIGQGISAILMSIYNLAGPVGQTLIGFTWILLVSTGMHLPIAMMGIVDLTQNGIEQVIFPSIMGILFAGPATNIGVIFKTKDKKIRELATSGLVSAILGGVIEPSLYGIYLKYRKVLFAEMFGAAMFAFVSSLLNVSYYSFSANNFLAFIGFIGPNNNLLKFLIAGVVGGASSLIAVLVLGVESQNRVKEY